MNENSASNVDASLQAVEPNLEERFLKVERMLNIQQELLQKLVSIQEPPPPPAPTPSDIYERAREKAQFTDYHQWDSLYIHGLVRVDGEMSSRMINNPPCEPCQKDNRVCFVLTEEDPYREFLFTKRNICCGWCEYSTSLVLHNQRPQEGKRAQNMQTFFIPGAGILREVITADISMYLGNSATVKPGVYTVWKPHYKPSDMMLTC